jgi:peroxiredoxin
VCGVFTKRFSHVTSALKVLAALSAFALVALSSPRSVIGTRLENFQLADSSGKSHSLNDYKGKIVILSFWSFKCPVSLTYDKRLGELEQQYGPKGVVVLGIDSNSDETAEAVQKNAAGLNLSYPILLDSQGVVADRLGATHSPSVFILDRDFIVRFEGMIDNGKRPGEKGREAYAEQALDSILAGRPVPVEVTKGGGCSIKRRGF